MTPLQPKVAPNCSRKLPKNDRKLQKVAGNDYLETGHDTLAVDALHSGRNDILVTEKDSLAAGHDPRVPETTPWWQETTPLQPEMIP